MLDMLSLREDHAFRWQPGLLLFCKIVRSVPKAAGWNGCCSHDGSCSPDVGATERARRSTIPRVDEGAE